MLGCLLFAGMAAADNKAPAGNSKTSEKAAVIAPSAEDVSGKFAKEQFQYGIYCMDKLKDVEQGFKYIELAAKQNYREAWLYLSRYYFSRKNENREYLRWAKLCLLAAERIEADPEQEISIAMIEGFYGNWQEFCKWMKMAADKGHKNAAKYLNSKELKAEIEDIRKKIEAEKKAPLNALGKSINAHIDKLGKTFGNDVSEMFNTLQGKTYMSGRSNMLRLPQPEGIKLKNWTYNAQATEKIIADKLIVDRLGDTCWIYEEFYKQPIHENLAYPNPTVRAINATYEDELMKFLKNAPYRVCKKDEIKKLIKPFMAEHVSKDYYDEDQVWDLGDNLYFRIHTASDGAWKLRDYQFFLVKDGKSVNVVTFPNPPDAADADMVAGLVIGNADCINNLAVKYANGEMDQIFSSEEEAETILHELVKLRHAAGTFNLGIYYMSRNKKAEAEKYFKLAKKFSKNR